MSFSSVTSTTSVLRSSGEAIAAIRQGWARRQRVFGRLPDLYLRKRAQAGAPANWVRVWRAPINYRGQFVFVAQTGRPIGGRYLPDDARDLRLHPDVDEVRNFLISDFMYSGGLEKLAFVSGVGAVPADQPRSLAGGDSYYTDGRRVALVPGHAAADDLRRRSPGLGTAIVRARGRGGAAEGALRWGSLVESLQWSIAGRPQQARMSSAQQHGRHCWWR